MNYLDVLKVLSKNKNNRDYPGKQDPRYSDNFITPGFEPKFGIDMAHVNSVFTIGSCFARNIEEVLEPMGILLPTKRFVSPKDEFPARPNGLLNEYNPGSISQKIISTLRKEKIPEETIFKHADLYHDLLLHGGSGVSYERAINRRHEIDSIYEDLIKSEVVIITLGFVEAWYDNATMQWLNRMPPYNKNVDSNRFTFKRLDVYDVMPMLSEALSELDSLNKKIILTVSPVPISKTLTKSDCIVANEFSKSVLRVCAERLRAEFKNVDYYPSYEMARIPGLIAYKDDNIHVKDSIVAKITSHMVNKYQEAARIL
ncbi:GSCFA domain-containing protein [Polaromonas eurypsychrophila]|uniref:GSCFA domain-containing protein n=1 Tax=Polaromonas eurypsychrophila TaxID=1614635 RepID=UPI001666BA3D|nr:GSCFA domain-containing protein [Polaromonas eurypsychrophila]